MVGGMARAPTAKSSAAKGAAPQVTLNINELLTQFGVASAGAPAQAASYVRNNWRELQKSRRLGPEPDNLPVRVPKSSMVDPYSLIHAMGWRERLNGITNIMLKDIVAQLPPQAAIRNVRLAQLENFWQDARDSRQGIGLGVREKGTGRRKRMLPQAQARADELLLFLQRCGRPEQNPFSHIKRDNLRVHMRKVFADSIDFDALATEIVPDRFGRPFEFLAVDGTTIRFALDQNADNQMFMGRSAMRNVAVPLDPRRARSGYFANFDDQEYATLTPRGAPVKYVQVARGQIVTTYSEDELVYAVRNPRTDIYLAGYGYPEIMQAMTTVASMLFQDQYHRNYYKGANRGILWAKGGFPRKQMESFRRQYIQMAQGIENNFRTPFIDLGQDGAIDFLDFRQKEEETGSLKWGEQLLAMLCGVHLIEPDEISRHIGGVSQSPLFESSADWKLKASKDRGLPPLLRFGIDYLQNIMDRVDDHFEVTVEGLDSASMEDAHKMRMEDLATFRTVNEVRAEEGLVPLPFGDIPLNATYTAYIATQMAPPEEGGAGGEKPKQDFFIGPEGGKWDDAALTQHYKEPRNKNKPGGDAKPAPAPSPNEVH